LIILDASAAIELFVNTDRAVGIADRLRGSDWCAPHLLDVEVLQVLRKLVRLGEVDEHDAAAAIERLALAPIFRFEHGPLADRIWALRENLTAYDAAYVALAEHFHAPLVTCDAKLAGTRVHRARVEVF
jgi:predicted nucleic acid-binding protein